MSRIAVNTCLKALRAEKARPELRRADLSEEQESVLDWLSTTNEDLRPDRDVASREWVEKMLGQLKPLDRLVVSLMHLEGKSLEEVRHVTGWKPAGGEGSGLPGAGETEKSIQTLDAGGKSMTPVDEQLNRLIKAAQRSAAPRGRRPFPHSGRAY